MNRHHRRAFTLTELVVAVGLVTVLTLGIGRLFSTGSNLTGTGAAIAETDALARALESALLRDIEGFNALPADQSFLAIRNTQLGGDLDFSSNTRLENPSATQGEVALYITREAQPRDARRGALPYPQDSTAVTVRMDELIFPTSGASRGGFRSFQEDPTGRNPVTAPNAIVSFGHGLLRAPDPNYDPNAIVTDPTDRSAFNNPVWRPDGETGFEFFRAFGAVGSRNEFAGSFGLMRQQVLLYGGIATGFPISAARDAPIGNDREYTLYMRDFGTASYLNNLGRVPTIPGTGPQLEIEPNDPSGGATNLDFPNPRARWMGRTDICAQSLSTLRRWVEGEEDLPLDEFNRTYVSVDYPEIVGPNNINAFIPRDATAFDAGVFNVDRRFLGPGDPDFRIWQRRSGIDNPAVNAFNGQAPLLKADAYAENMRNLQSSIAGMFSRPLYDPEPFPARRTDPAAGVGVNDPADQRMDIHALIAQRCSNFEVAWSDGTVWPFDETLRVDTGGGYDTSDATTLERVIRRGDIIWFDMNFTRQDLWDCLTANTRAAGSPSDPRPLIAPNATFSNPNNIEAAFVPPYGNLADAQRDFPPFFPCPEIGDRRGTPSTPPLYYPLADGTFDPINGSDPGAIATESFGNTQGRDNRLQGFREVVDGSWSDPQNVSAAYAASLTGGRLPDQGDEYFASFGFRAPAGTNENLATRGALDDTYIGAWNKPRLLRVRTTLHDRQFRLQGGRTYEFIFELNPSGSF